MDPLSSAIHFKPPSPVKCPEIKPETHSYKAPQAPEDTSQMSELIAILEKWVLEPKLPGIDVRLHRRITTERINIIAPLINAEEVIRNPQSFERAWELLNLIDPSLATKVGVLIFLYRGSLCLLGTDFHKQFLNKPGCFAMTEIGHGSNVLGIQTTATYDKETDSFIIDSPTLRSQKFFIGNAANDAQIAVVFAQLILPDGTEAGVNAFVVPIRNEDGSPVPGVEIIDCGDKLGMQGVDNGGLRFRQVRIPRSFHLNKLSEVDREGNYNTYIKKKEDAHGNRIKDDEPKSIFGPVIAALIYGRIFLTVGCAISMAFLAILLHKKCPQIPTSILIPLIADAFAFRLAKTHAMNHREDHGLVSGIKVVVSEETGTAYQDMFFFVRNFNSRLAQMLLGINCDQVVTQTFEGDSQVLRQLVEKENLKQLYNYLSTLSFNISSIISNLKNIYTQWNDPIRQAERTVLWEEIKIGLQIAKADLWTKENIMDVWNRNLLFNIKPTSDLHIHIQIAKLFDETDPLMKLLKEVYIAKHIQPSAEALNDLHDRLKNHIPELIDRLTKDLNLSDEVIEACMKTVIPQTLEEQPTPPTFFKDLFEDKPDLIDLLNTFKDYTPESIGRLEKDPALRKKVEDSFKIVITQTLKQISTLQESLEKICEAKPELNDVLDKLKDHMPKLIDQLATDLDLTEELQECLISVIPPEQIPTLLRSLREGFQKKKVSFSPLKAHL